MIPELDDNGCPPEGIHAATLDEIERRFGQESELRRSQMQSLRWLVELADRDDVRRIIVHGSFVTDAAEPNDVDCVLLAGPSFGNRAVSAREWSEGLPFIHFEVVDERALQDYASRIFARGRHLVRKGMIEVVR